MTPWQGVEMVLFNTLPGPRGCTGRPASGFTPQAGQLLSVEEGANGDFLNGLLAMKQSLVICTVCHTAFASVGVDLPNMPHCPRCGAHMGALAVRERAAGPAIGVTPERRCLSRHTTRIPRRHSRR